MNLVIIIPCQHPTEGGSVIKISDGEIVQKVVDFRLDIDQGYYSQRGLYYWRRHDVCNLSQSNEL